MVSGRHGKAAMIVVFGCFLGLTGALVCFENKDAQAKTAGFDVKKPRPESRLFRICRAEA